MGSVHQIIVAIRQLDSSDCEPILEANEGLVQKPQHARRRCACGFDGAPKDWP
jgi:hypothetical protein